LAAATRPVLIDQELIVILDQKLRGIAGVLVGVAEQAAGDDQVAGEQRRTALADQPLADDQGLDAAFFQTQRSIAPGASGPDDGYVRHYGPHDWLPRCDAIMLSPMDLLASHWDKAISSTFFALPRVVLW
jgi:hypothetical protein